MRSTSYPFGTPPEVAPYARTRPVRDASTATWGSRGPSTSTRPALMRSVGLDPADVAAPDKWVSAAAVARLLDVSAAESGERELRRPARRAAPADHARSAERRAARGAGPAQRPSTPDALRARVQRSPPHAPGRVGGDRDDPALVRVRGACPGGQALALGVAALHGIIRECVGPHWRPLAVCFQGRAPADLSTLHKVFGPGLQFEHDFTGLIFYASDLDARNALSDPLMRPYAQRFLDSLVSPRTSSSSDRVKEVVELLLPLGKCSMDQVARTLDMDRRTLHRHLAREGESFSSILQLDPGRARRAAPGERAVLHDRRRAPARVRGTSASPDGSSSSSASARASGESDGPQPCRWRRPRRPSKGQVS